MRVVWSIALLALVSLSGCASGGGLQAYLVQPMDLPSGCHYADFSSDEAQEIREEANWTSNPGRVDNNDFWGDDITSTWLAILDCPEEGDEVEVISVAMQFAHVENATAFAHGFGADSCESTDGDMGILLGGSVVTFFNVDGDSLLSEVEGITRAIGLRTGAVDICAEVMEEL